MESYRANKFLFVTSVLSILILILGTTFSYFTVSNRSEYDAVKVEANKIELALAIEQLYTGHSLIPMDDEDINKAYNNKCKDIYGYGACLAYTLEVSNFNSQQDLIGTIDFNVTGIENLNYMLLDEEGKPYLDKQSIGNGITEDLSLGEHFILKDATKNNPSVKKFILLVWLSNFNYDQNDIDGSGSFTAAISYESVINGGKLTGSLTNNIVDGSDDTGADEV